MKEIKPIATFDVETDPFKAGRIPEVFSAAFYDGVNHNVFWGENALKKCLKLMLQYEGPIYAHNGGKFDFHYLIPLLPWKGKNKATVFMIKSRMAKIKCGKMELRDSFLILPVKLAVFAKEEIDYRKFEADVREKHKAEIVHYLKKDCEYLSNAITDFIDLYGDGLTLAGRTFHILANRFKLKPVKSTERQDELFRKYYYGGRCQFFELGELGGGFSCYDINSAYPRAMMDNHFFGVESMRVSKLPENIETLKRSFVRLIAESEGALPIRNEKGAIEFPTGEREFFATGWELFAGLELGAVKIKSVKEVITPLRTENFQDYIKHFYQLKKDAPVEAEVIFAKLMLNSLYGRFALNPREFRDVQIVNYGEILPDPWKLSSRFPLKGFDVYTRPTPLKPGAFFNVATAASITGWVRAFLFRSLSTVERPVYCDTDSIICKFPGNLIQGKDLGEWKHEADFEELYIAGKKLYSGKMPCGKWKTASKGVRLSPEEIKGVALGEDATMTFDAPNFSLFGAGREFTTRTVRRDDRRIKR